MPTPSSTCSYPSSSKQRSSRQSCTVKAADDQGAPASQLPCLDKEYQLPWRRQKSFYKACVNHWEKSTRCCWFLETKPWSPSHYLHYQQTASEQAPKGIIENPSSVSREEKQDLPHFRCSWCHVSSDSPSNELLSTPSHLLLFYFILFYLLFSPTFFFVSKPVSNVFQSKQLT